MARARLSRRRGEAEQEPAIHPTVRYTLFYIFFFSSLLLIAAFGLVAEF